MDGGGRCGSAVALAVVAVIVVLMVKEIRRPCDLVESWHDVAHGSHATSATSDLAGTHCVGARAGASMAVVVVGDEWWLW